MIVIQKDGCYVKVHKGTPMLTTTLGKATKFADDFEAEKYITNQIKKSQRELYNVIHINSKESSKISVSNTQISNNNKSTTISLLEDIKSKVEQKLGSQKNNYCQQLKYYDDAILDIRHYIRDENTKLNACQAAKLLYKLQQTERKRAEVKCELQRIGQVLDSISHAIDSANDFEYAPYKPRVIDDMGEFLKT